MMITAQTLRHLITCEHRAWLEQNSDSALQGEVAQSPFILGIQHERAVLQATTQTAEAIPVNSWQSGVDVTRTLMKRGVAGIIGAYLEQEVMLVPLLPPVIVRGKVDR